MGIAIATPAFAIIAHAINNATRRTNGCRACLRRRMAELAECGFTTENVTQVACLRKSTRLP